MNGPFKIAHKLTVTAVPKEFDFLVPPPLLLPGECLEQYQALRQTIFADIEPRSSIEWLLAIDVAELSWRSGVTMSYATSFSKPIDSKPSKRSYAAST